MQTTESRPIWIWSFRSAGRIDASLLLILHPRVKTSAVRFFSVVIQEENGHPIIKKKSQNVIKPKLFLTHSHTRQERLRVQEKRRTTA
jgi:hypothetical protein